MRQDIDIFNEALADESACDLDTPTSMARLLLGVKIVRDNETGVVKIYDTSRSSFYREISNEERSAFSETGWRAGVLEVFNTRYQRRLAKLWDNITREKNTKNRARVVGAMEREIDNLSDRKNELLSKYGYED